MNRDTHEITSRCVIIIFVHFVSILTEFTIAGTSLHHNISHACTKKLKLYSGVNVLVVMHLYVPEMFQSLSKI